MLHSTGTTRQVTVPVSAGLLGDPERYFDALSAYRDGDLVPIVSVFTDYSFAAISNFGQLIADLDEVRTEWGETVTGRLTGSSTRSTVSLPERAEPGSRP